MGTGRRDAETGRGKSADDGRSRPPDAGVRGNSDGLVDCHDVVVGVEDLHSLDRCRFDGQGPRRFGQDYLEPRPCGQTIGLADGHTVDEYRAFFRECRDHGARESEKAREAGIDAHGIETVGHGHRTGFPHLVSPSAAAFDSVSFLSSAL